MAKTISHMKLTCQEDRSQVMVEIWNFFNYLSERTCFSLQTICLLKEIEDIMTKELTDPSIQSQLESFVKELYEYNQNSLNDSQHSQEISQKEIQKLLLNIKQKPESRIQEIRDKLSTFPSSILKNYFSSSIFLEEQNVEYARFPVLKGTPLALFRVSRVQPILISLFSANEYLRQTTNVQQRFFSTNQKLFNEESKLPYYLQKTPLELQKDFLTKKCCVCKSSLDSTTPVVIPEIFLSSSYKKYAFIYNPTTTKPSVPCFHVSHTECLIDYLQKLKTNCPVCQCSRIEFQRGQISVVEEEIGLSFPHLYPIQKEAVDHFQNRRYGHAVERYSKLLDLLMNFPDKLSKGMKEYFLSVAYYQRSLSYFCMEDYSKSLTDSESLISISSNSHQGYLQKAECLIKIFNSQPKLKHQNFHTPHKMDSITQTETIFYYLYNSLLLECKNQNGHSNGSTNNSSLTRTQKLLLETLIKYYTMWRDSSEIKRTHDNSEEIGIQSSNQNSKIIMKDLLCPICLNIFYQPKTLLCGHTICSLCISKIEILSPNNTSLHQSPNNSPSQIPFNSHNPFICPLCPSSSSSSLNLTTQLPSSSSIHINLVLQQLILHLFPEHTKMWNLILEGKRDQSSNNFYGALEKFQQAAQRHHTHEIFLCRAQCFVSLGKYEDAYREIRYAYNLQPRSCEVNELISEIMHILYENKSSILSQYDETQLKREIFVHLCEAERNSFLKKKLLYKNILSILTTSSNHFLIESSSTISLFPREKVCFSLPEVTTQLKGINQNISIDWFSNCFECSVCFDLISSPVSIQCGHTFCSVCLTRTLDHQPQCGLCRQPISRILHTNKQLKSILKNIFTEHYISSNSVPMITEEREENTSNSEELPIFVCTILFPEMECPLHIFEPRYRLMIRNCLQQPPSKRHFGMVIPLQNSANGHTYYEYGTTAEIEDVRVLPDGRSFVRTTGGRRFKVGQRWMQDGYNMARVEWVEDVQEPEQVVTQEWNSVLQKFNNLLSRIPRLRETVEEKIGEIPSTPDKFVWWYCSFFREPHQTAPLLGSTSKLSRLRMISSWISQY